jgi:hypothetical protein
MSLSKNPAAYEHVQKVLDAVVGLPSARYRCPSKSAAMRFRAEAYMYRKICGSPKYDGLTFKLEGETVVISVRQVEGVIETGDGQPIEPAASKLETDFEAEAFGLAKKLGLDIL